MPPVLPPRMPSTASVTSNEEGFYPPIRNDTVHLTPRASYSRPSNHPYSSSIGLDDPRSSSTQSLRPVESAGARRRLLLVYIHGFMGTETSFKSFPAHVHSLLTLMLAESHVIHTKIYPRYQSRKNISFARDAFSNWLYPHESDMTDVVLLGHSLGGILGAEVLILPSHVHGSRELLQHRILGLIAYDTPFLGMHPGVVSTGIASLFRSAPDLPPEPEQTNTSEVFDASQQDPNYNPSFPNDVRMPVRNNWERAWYFFNKHSGDLRKATQSYVKSHLEFGGCLADYPGLKKRYEDIRCLEDVDELAEPKTSDGKLIRRRRFVNYYSASTGRIKEEKVSDGQLIFESEMQDMTLESNNTIETTNNVAPQISVEEHKDEDENLPDMVLLEPRYEEISDGGEAETSTHAFAVSSNVVEETETASIENSQTRNDMRETASLHSHQDLPPIPPEPETPPALDLSNTTAPDVIKLVQAEHHQQMKTYERAMKDREKAIKNREKIIAKRERLAEKEEEKKAKQLRQEQQRIERERLKRQATLNPEKEVHDETREKKKRDRKFCSLPAKDTRTGLRDSTWIRVYMEGVDEVVAHTTLFNVSDTYAKLVGDTAERITEWVNEDATTKALLHEKELGGI